MWHAGKSIYLEEGVYGYLKGNGTNVIRIVPYSAVQFASYEEYKALLSPEIGEMTTPRRLVAGGLAGMTAVAVTYPLDLIRTRLSALENVRGQYNGIWSAFRVITRQEGFVGLYRGLFATSLGVIPYNAIQFNTYELMKMFLAGERDMADLTVSEKLTCGATAGATAQTITYPLDVIRRRMQMSAVNTPERQYCGVVDCFSRTLRVEGVRGLYAGLLPNFLKVVPAMSTSFVCYEFTKSWLMGDKKS